MHRRRCSAYISWEKENSTPRQAGSSRFPWEAGRVRRNMVQILYRVFVGKATLSRVNSLGLGHLNNVRGLWPRGVGSGSLLSGLPLGQWEHWLGM